MGAGGLSRKTGKGWPWVALFVIVQEASLGAFEYFRFTFGRKACEVHLQEHR